MEIKTEIKKAGQYYIYTPKESIVFIAPIFIELNLLNSITRYSILNLTQKQWRNTEGMGQNFIYTLQVKYGRQWVDFKEIHARLTTFNNELRCQISWRFDKQFSRLY